MKKLFSLTVAIIISSCSTSSDDNGNSMTTVVPVPPTNLIGTAASPTQINLSWTDNSTNETGFKIQRRTGSENYAIVGTVNEDVLTFSDSGLLPSTTYTYRVYAYNTAGNSPTYSNEVSFTTVAALPSVAIGTQIWSSTNLDVTTYRDGTPIPQVTDPAQWSNLNKGAWCYCNNSTTNGTTYGKLYNWYAVAGIHDTDPNTPDKVLAPQGWHVATDSELTTLTSFLGAVAGGKMKSTGTSLWRSPNTGATNASGFTGLPGSGRNDNDGSFGGIGDYGFWWSSSESTTGGAWSCFLSYSSGEAGKGNFGKKAGMSVRCLRD